jgi:trk system potassium uptake protein TrkH
MGRFLRLFALAFLAPLLMALVDGDRSFALGCAVAAAATFGAGLLAALAFRGRYEFRRSEAVGVVALTWLAMGSFGALPFLWTAMAPVDALFESISGLTTTGASIIADFSAFSRGVYVWRAMLHWIGGLGIIALFVLVLPTLGIGGRQLFFAEASSAPGEALRPQVRQNALRLFALYSAFTLAETTLLLVAGLPFYDALLNSMATVCSGGFSPNANSMGGYGNPAAEWIVTAFMLMAGLSFTLQWRFWTGAPRRLLGDGEFRYYVGAFVVATVVIAFILAPGLPDEAALRTSAFQVASLMSTTGFMSADYDRWDASARVLLVLLMAIGACAGSTGGGAKVVRYFIAGKFMRREFLQVLHPHAVLPLRWKRQPVTTPILRAVLMVVLLFLVSYVLLGVTLVLMGMDFVSGFTAAITCLNNCGPGLADVGPAKNYGGLSDSIKLVLCAAMWIGRLEIVTVLALLHPHVWRRLQWRGPQQRRI